MGVDVLLYAETTPTAQELEAARDLFRRSAIADDYTDNFGRVHWRCLEFEDETEWSAPRVVANVTCRYWDEGYERGDWPDIYGAIRLLQAAFPSARVFYGGDYDDTAPEVTEERLRDLWAHFLGPHGNDYRERKFAAPAHRSDRDQTESDDSCCTCGDLIAGAICHHATPPVATKEADR